MIKERGVVMKSRLMGVRDEDVMVVIKVLVENGFIVKVFQTDDTIAETIVEFWKKGEGWQE